MATKNYFDFEYINLPSIRLKEVVNNNPGPGQYNPSEKDLFGAKSKKFKIKDNNKKRNMKNPRFLNANTNTAICGYSYIIQLCSTTLHFI